MKLSTLQAWRQVYLAEVGLLAGATIAGAVRSPAGQGASACFPRALTWARRTVLAGALLWLMHDIAHRRWRSVQGDVLAVAGSVAGLQGGESRLAPLAPLLTLAGTIRSSAFPEVD